MQEDSVQDLRDDDNDMLVYVMDNIEFSLVDLGEMEGPSERIELAKKHIKKALKLLQDETRGRNSE